MRTRVKLLLVTLSLFLTVNTLTAQTQRIVYADGNPSPTVGGANAFPWCSVGIRYQAIFPHSIFGSNPLNIATIRDILVAGHILSGLTPGNLEAVYDDIEIKMGITRQTIPTTVWTVNNPKPTTVYRGPLRIRFTGAPASVWGGIGLPKPYFYLPLSNKDNLCVEVIVWKASQHSGNFYYPRAGSNLQRAFLFGWVNNQNASARVGAGGCRMAFALNNGNIAFAGKGCNSSANTPLVISTNPSWPQPGKSLSIRLAGGAKASPAFLVIGTKLVSFDLGAAGAPGCFLWSDILVPAPTSTNSSGAASFSATVPSTATAGTLLTHWLVFDNQANAARLTTSDYATLILGK
jgi:hypothetical protein